MRQIYPPFNRESGLNFPKKDIPSTMVAPTGQCMRRAAHELETKQLPNKKKISAKDRDPQAGTIQIGGRPQRHRGKSKTPASPAGLVFSGDTSSYRRRGHQVWRKPGQPRKPRRKIIALRHSAQQGRHTICHSQKLTGSSGMLTSAMSVKRRSNNA
jgi:hypothetical protein